MNWTIASMMAPVEMASMRETKLRSMLNCAPSNGSTMKRAIRIAIPYGSGVQTARNFTRNIPLQAALDER